jgi:hypothetical protein
MTSAAGIFSFRRAIGGAAGLAILATKLRADYNNRP